MAHYFPWWLLAAFACKIKAQRERERQGGGGGASECEGLSGNSGGTGHMSLLSLQDETPITGRVSGTFQMANSGRHTHTHTHTECDAGPMGGDATSDNMLYFNSTSFTVYVLML